MSTNDDSETSLIGVLAGWARRQPEAPALTYLADGESDERTVSYAALLRSAGAIGAALRRSLSPGDRALLLYPPGLEFAEAFLGCLAARVIAVPAYPPGPARRERHAARLAALVRSCRPGALLTVERHLGDFAPFVDRLAADSALPLIATDLLRGGGGEEDLELPAADDLAFLQYTSGSTSAPKGVMVSNANLVANERALQQAILSSSETTVFTWLPAYHDMGLIGTILHPLFIGARGVMMSPAHFVQKPQRWLNGIARYRAVMSAAPNFAYDLVARAISAEAAAGLDLSCWRMALNGAEPVRYETLRRFADALAPAGFRLQSFIPGFGLAESTLMVAAARMERPDRAAVWVDRRRLTERAVVMAEEGDREATALVSCGEAPAGQVRIASPESGRALPEREIGEIWVSGPSVARGYWGDPARSEETFRARMEGEPPVPHLRTGDLGFLDQGRLFVTGRMKDLIILRGRNYYPQDIEQTVLASHPALAPAGGCAFSVEEGGEERLVVVHAIDPRRTEQAGEAIAAARGAISGEHEVPVHTVVLVPPRQIPKTTSGKVQRRACRQAFLDGRLEEVARWTLPSEEGAAAPPAPLDAEPARWAARIAELVAAAAGLSPAEVDPGRPLWDQGLGSVALVRLTSALEKATGRTLSPTLAWEHPTVAALAAYLAGTEAEGATRSAPAASARAGEPVAIVGIGCRFPGADGPEAFWRLLREGADAITEVPKDRYDVAALFDPDPAQPGKLTTRWGGFLDEVQSFDPRLFDISPREAAHMDPQQRLVLEAAWRALEDAGLAPERIARRRAGVFVGISTYEYMSRFNRLELVGPYTGTGNALSIAANRLSYVFDLHGPSVAVDTACSSSLVAVHMACESLRRGECELALAGGVNVILSPLITINFSKAGAMAADGRCKTFDGRADGYVRSEGVGVVVLKPLSRALADGDDVYAVVLGSAVNSDGRSNGLLAPSPRAQVEVIRQAYASAGVHPAAAAYVEAHGTGTRLGDPIEVQALAEAMAPGRAEGQVLALGSVKTNIGHTEAAAGIAGLIKTALCIKHRTLVPSLHYQSANPHIPFEKLPLRVQTEAAPWPDGQALLAGVSSFGFGGTNCHLVVGAGGEAPAKDAASGPALRLLPISAHSGDALELRLRGLARWLREHPDAGDWAAVCRTSGVGRAHLAERAALAASDALEAAARLEAHLRGEEGAGLLLGRRPTTGAPHAVFVFSGQGGSWPGMGRRLLQTEPVFREALGRCSAAHERLGGPSLVGLLEAVDGAAVEETETGQPLVVSVQIALAALWRSWGLRPRLVVGHSLGEVAAACAAGALSPEQAMEIALHRGRLMKRVEGRGAMAAVALPADEIRRRFGEAVTVAAYNAPDACVVAGSPEAIEQLVSDLGAQDVFCRPVRVKVAGHSPFMDEIQGELAGALAHLRPAVGDLPIASTVTGGLVRGDELDGAYWARNLREPVRFSDALSQAPEGDLLVVEVGPHPLLLESARAVLASRRRPPATVASLRRNEDERATLLQGLGAAYAAGMDVAWEAFGRPARRVPLPGLPMVKERCWVELDGPAPESPQPSPPRRHRFDLAGPVPVVGTPGRRLWQASLDLRAYPFLRDHQVQDEVILPATGFIELALEALHGAAGGTWRLREVKLHQVLPLPAGEAVQVQIQADPRPEGGERVTLFSRQRPSSPWRRHLTALAEETGSQTGPAERVDLDRLSAALGETVAEDSLYQWQRERGRAYTGPFAALRDIRRGEDECLARLGSEDSSPPPLCAVLDCALQALGAVIATRQDVAADVVLLPVSFDRVWSPGLAGERPAATWTHARITAADGEAIRGEVRLLDASGAVVAELRGVCLKAVDGLPDQAGETAGWLYRRAFIPRPPPAPNPLLGRGSWILFADAGPVGAALSELLARRGEPCLVVRRGTGFERRSDALVTIDPREPGHVERAFGCILGERRPPLRGLLYLWGLDQATPAATGAPGERVIDLCLPMAGVARALEAVGWDEKRPPAVFVVTRGSQEVPGGGESRQVPEDGAAVQAALWGFCAGLSHELAGTRCVRIDLDPAAPAKEVAMLHHELWLDARDPQVAFRGNGRYVARLHRAERPPPAAGAELFRYEVVEPGSVAGLGRVPVQRRALARDEVEVAVRAAGLNFRDLFLLLGLYQRSEGEEEALLGGECAGTVTRVGAGVSSVHAGDEVMAVAPASMGRLAVTRAPLVARVPPGCGPEAAATVPIAFLTTHYALNHVARLAPGERVLVHAATGGVGLAAIQVARAREARILATAGSEEKRAVLREMGIEHVGDSRSPDWLPWVLQATGGQGVDVVLNSLPGDAISKGLKALAPNGRFIELGKLDLFTGGQLDLSLFRRGIGFFSVDIARLSRERPALIQQLLQEISALIEEGRLSPLPFSRFAEDAAPDAFATMAERRYVGKLVVAFEGAAAFPTRPALRPDGTYLITGGLGALGALTASWMVDRGARHLALLGRRPPGAEAQRVVDRLRRRGAEVRCVAADVGDAAALAGALEMIRAAMPPFRGVVHAAGALADAPLSAQDAARLHAVLYPKALGAWNLHRLTADDPLDFFVLYSSLAPVVGSPGQSNYSAANAFLDALAQARRAAGRPAQSIAWGAWGGLGLARVGGLEQRLEEQGFGVIRPSAAASLLDQLLTANSPHAVVTAADWERVAEAGWTATTSLVADLVAQAVGPAPKRPAAAGPVAPRGMAPPAQAASPRTMLRRPGDLDRASLLAAEAAQHLELLATYVQTLVSRALGVPPARIDREQSLPDLGLDSIMSMEVRSALQRAMDVQVPVAVLLKGPSTNQLARYVLDRLKPASDAPPAPHA